MLTKSKQEGHLIISDVRVMHFYVGYKISKFPIKFKFPATKEN
jgi:hypothetical protein